MTSAITQRLTELNITLPEVVTPVASYVPAAIVGDQVWTSGQLPFTDGALPATGLCGDTITTEQANSLARQAALNALAAIDSVAGLDNVVKILKVTGFVASADGYHEQPQVINGASDVLGEIFGEAGKHVRSAVGVAQLPLGSPVELEVVAQIKR